MRASGSRTAGSMIGLPASTEIRIAAGVTDLRRGFTGLSAIAQTVLEKCPFSGHVFVFRGRRGDLLKLLWFDGAAERREIVVQSEEKIRIGATAPNLGHFFSFEVLFGTYRTSCWEIVD
jgi:hypothetical protein